MPCPIRGSPQRSHDDYKWDADIWTMTCVTRASATVQLFVRRGVDGSDATLRRDALLTEMGDRKRISGLEESASGIRYNSSKLQQSRKTL